MDTVDVAHSASLVPDRPGAIAHYLASAGHGSLPDEPLFRSADHRPRHAGGRLTVDGLYFLVRRYGRAIGVPNLTPHRLRHSSITCALDATGEDIRRVQRPPATPT